jgi:hypothetical protein
MLNAGKPQPSRSLTTKHASNSSTDQGGGKRRAGICGPISSQEKTATTEPCAGPYLLRSSSEPDRCCTYSSRSFSQLSDCALGMRKCRRYIRQVCASRVILDPCPSAYRKEISRHSRCLGTPGRRTTACASLDWVSTLAPRIGYAFNNSPRRSRL